MTLEEALKIVDESKDFPDEVSREKARKAVRQAWVKEDEFETED
jgi:hypothetical protein